MVTPQEFLGAVLPSSGWYCSIAIGADKVPQQSFVSTIEDLNAMAVRHATDNKDAYFAVASFSESGSRKAANVRSHKALYVDLDVGEKKPYTNAAQALAGLGEFIDSTGLAMPVVVRSGYGVHAYWPFASEMTPHDWQGLAGQFKALCLAKGLYIDPSATADAARVLRVPDTLNFKNPDAPKKVRVLSEVIEAVDPTAFAAAVAALLGTAPTPKPRQIEMIPGIPLESPTRVALQADTQSSFKKILSLSAAGRGCMQIKQYLENAALEGTEPLWRAVLSVAKPCSDGEPLALDISALHPYDEVRFRSKWSTLVGPWRCSEFEKNWPSTCGRCSWRGRISSPVQLGAEMKAPPAPSSPVPSPAPKPQGAQDPLVARATPPAEGFSFGLSGGVYFLKKERAPDGTSVEFPVQVYPRTLAILGTRVDENGDYSIHIGVDAPGGVREFTIPYGSLHSKSEALKEFAKNGLVATLVGAGDDLLYRYVRSTAHGLSVTKEAQIIPNTFGWQEDRAFVLNTYRVTDSGTFPVPRHPSLSNLYTITKPCGTLDGWRNVVNMVLSKRRYDVLFGMLTAFGAPLMPVVGEGLNGLLIHMFSTRSGTGKSASLKLAASVFGHPQHYWLKVDTSEVTTQNRLGLLKNLPLVIDEVTSRMRDERGNAGWVSRMLLDITTGKGKERLDSSSIKERRNTTSWATLALTSGNASMVDALNSMGHAVEGENMRLLEIGVHDSLVLSKDEEATLGSLNQNFGLVGLRYMEWVLKHQAEVRERFNKVNEVLRSVGDFRGAERYWLNGVCVMLTGCDILRDAGIIDLPTDVLLTTAVSYVQASRKQATESKTTASEVLQKFLAQNYGRLVIVEKRNSAMLYKMGREEYKDESLARNDILGRFERGVTQGHVTLYVLRTALATFCSKAHYSKEELLAELPKEGITVDDGCRADLFAGTRFHSGVRSRVVRLDMPAGLENESADIKAGH